ncbi:MAG: hypothetical protein RJB26_690 [Pseudomonadota bacterium]|jgi:hypothetical protein
MAYETLANLRRWLNITSSSDDDILQAALDDATAHIERETLRVWAAIADTTRRFDAVVDVRGRTLVFDAEIASITSITNGNGASVAASQYVTEPRNASPATAVTLKLNSTTEWTWSTSPEDAIAVTGRWAATITPPDDIVRACRRLAAWYYLQRRNPDDLDRPIVTADGMTLTPSRVPSDVAGPLRSRRRITL